MQNQVNLSVDLNKPVESRREIFLDRAMEHDHSWSIRKIVRFIQYPTVMNMITHKDEALLLKIIITQLQANQNKC